MIFLCQTLGKRDKRVVERSTLKQQLSPAGAHAEPQPEVAAVQGVTIVLGHLSPLSGVRDLKILFYVCPLF